MYKKTGFSLQVTGIALAVSQAFAPEAMAQQQAAEQTVVVTGIRASARSSVAIKRDTMEVVDSITADDIGKLPDLNVAETMTRIPGVQGYRYGGEGASPVGAGSGLTIRGLSGQTASQINGRAFNTAGGREFNIESAIPGMIAGVDVYKNPSAEHIEGGIGGLVNIRNRNPSDFKGPTVAASISFSNNDLAKKTDPELFVMGANRIDLGGGSRIGVMGAAVYQKSTGRSDNNPANRGGSLKRAVRADSAEYATRAAANTANSPFQPMSAYVGRSDVNFMDNVGTTGANMPNLAGLTADQISNVISATGVNSNAFQETIMRERKGLNLAGDYRVSNTLRFYAEANYVYYLYHQNYRGLNSVDGANVQNLQTTPFNYTEALANRNINGGSNDVLVSKRLLSGSFLNSAVTSMGGDEHTPYTTWVGAAGAEWSPTADLSLKADFSYIKSDKTQDNRNVLMDSAPGKLWSTNRIADGAPHQLTFTGPDLSDPANFVFRQYENGSNQSWDDSGHATALSGAYSLDVGPFNRLKFGTRYAHMDSLYKNFRPGSRPLTTDGLALTANRSNAINASTMGSAIERAPTNFMGGDAGYAGGFAVYKPDALLGNQVQTAFPKSGIPQDGAYPELAGERRYVEENTLAGYLVGEFSAMDERLKGSVGVRVVRTTGTAVARATGLNGALVDVVGKTSYTNSLPTFNATYDISKESLVRFAYGRGMTRAGIGDLNPSISGVNTSTGTANVGNPDLRPLVADSFDLSLEHYFSKTNYASLAVFDKQIDGFFNNLLSCQTLDPAVAGPYTGSVGNGCSGGQYSVSKRVNAEKGYARGVEVAGQYFFDGAEGILKNFGVSGSYTYVTTANPLNFGTAAAPRVVRMAQPFQSKHNYSVSGMYEDKKLSARLAYTWRSMSLFNDVAINPIDSRSIDAYGILDGSINYEIADNLTLSFNAKNITNKALHRYIGEPDYKTGIELQHYGNGRTFVLGLRYKFGAL
ncbi:TonB-dependent receptor [Pseudoduganella namucuonensis]|uniref:TonB-dependent receptor n=1 Tax=Pseudoduganella namucuonensis TaxID=1035707 RepID=A0A1I7H7E4_9BURK|nr:TonB-dependent receptor [Pseudoduganella namucuonensis]SFU56592.1 TonB-dependent receptor [Pseudoduganella namucuonensis]